MSQSTCRQLTAVLVVTAILSPADAAELPEANCRPRAKLILKEAACTGGLIVHVDCGDGRLTAALKQEDHIVVHGLTRNAANLEAARSRLQARKFDGSVSVELWNTTTMPYADNLVNLLLVDAGTELPPEEVLRVLVPGGVLIKLNADSSIHSSVRKPWPDELDQWTHFLHDPGNNAVARDSAVGPPERLQWTADPWWSREHDVTPSVFAPVSCNGRLFYILNEGPNCTIGPEIPDRYSIVARDAFNGIQLWKRPISGWYSSRVIWGHVPMHMQRRLVAVGKRVYVTEGMQSPVTALDAATGEVVQEYRGTECTAEIVFSDGKLALVTRETHELDGLLAGRDGNRFRKGYLGTQEGGERLIVVCAETGQQLWSKPHRCMPLTLAVIGDRVLFAESEAVRCLELDTGRQIWSVDCQDVRTLVAHKDTVFVANADRKQITLRALDLATGTQLWSREGDPLPNFLFFFGPLDIFVAQDLVWGLADGLELIKRPGSGDLLGLDRRSGQIRQRIPLSGAFTTDHHVRCYKGKATENFLLFNKRGIEFIALDREQPPVPNSYQWVRGTCRYGILPCNGLIYAPPHACACYPGAKVDGFVALAAQGGRKDDGGSKKEEHRLQTGPAYSAEQASPLPSPASGLRSDPTWPTYRGDARRSGRASSPVPANLAIAWEATAGGKLTSPVVAEGVVLAAAIDNYVLHAWDAGDGRSLWTYVTGGRIDSPPTIHRGTAIFGCRDGWVYCLRLADGQLSWRFRAAPDERRVGARGRLESAWPVHGSVLIRDGIAYFAAGRSSFLDGGIFVYGLDAATGQLRHQLHLAGPDPQAETSRVTAGRMPGAVPDILTCDDSGLYLRHIRLDWQLSPPPPEQFDWNVKNETHLLPGSGFLDDTLFNRTIWQYGTRIDRSQMLCIDGTDVYGLRIYEGISWNCPIHHVGDGHLIFRQDISRPVPPPRPQDRGRMIRIPTERYVWHTRLPLRVSAMLLSAGPEQRLFVAGVPDELDKEDPLAYIEGRRGARLAVLDTATGRQMSHLGLESPPTWDGMAAAHGRLYLSTADGTLVCLAEQ